MKDNAQSVASGCLSKSGGTMSGDILMGANCIKESTVSAGVSFEGLLWGGGIVLNKSSNSQGATDAISLSKASNNGFKISAAYNGETAKSLKIRGVADPEYDSDAANKAYVDSKAGGLVKVAKSSFWGPKDETVYLSSTSDFFIICCSQYKHSIAGFTYGQPTDGNQILDNYVRIYYGGTNTIKINASSTVSVSYAIYQLP